MAEGNFNSAVIGCSFVPIAFVEVVTHMFPLIFTAIKLIVFTVGHTPCHTFFSTTLTYTNTYEEYITFIKMVKILAEFVIPCGGGGGWVCGVLLTKNRSKLHTKIQCEIMSTVSNWTI